jgi:hypothetical protein
MKKRKKRVESDRDGLTHVQDKWSMKMIDVGDETRVKLDEQIEMTEPPFGV